MALSEEGILVIILISVATVSSRPQYGVFSSSGDLRSFSPPPLSQCSCSESPLPFSPQPDSYYQPTYGSIPIYLNIKCETSPTSIVPISCPGKPPTPPPTQGLINALLKIPEAIVDLTS